MALNMMDIVEKRGMEIDLHRLPGNAGYPGYPLFRPGSGGGWMFYSMRQPIIKTAPVLTD